MSYAFTRSAEAVRQAVPLVEYASRYTKLQRRGHVLVGRCPLPDHEDKTPSFTIWPEQQTWHCFGCGEDRDVIDLHRAIHGHREVWGAMVSLAEEYGVELPGRSQRWHEATHRKSRYLSAAARVRGNILKRRLFRILILPTIKAIEDQEERRMELRRSWDEWGRELDWPQIAEWIVRSPSEAIAAVARDLGEAKAEAIVAEELVHFQQSA